MKLYVLMTSLMLAAGAGIGYWHGKGSTEARIVNACMDTRLTVVYDHLNDAHRHFHCFELEARKPAAPPPTSVRAEQLVL